MRMIGIGLLGFLLAGVALLLSTMNLWERAQWAVLTKVNGPQLIFETPAATQASDEETAIVLRSSPDLSVILSGLPAYQGVTFNLPQNARPTSGYLQIDATLQVLSGVEGVLRVSIDNVRRGEMLLHPGAASRSLQVPLSPRDLAGEQLVVSFSLQGDGPAAMCQSDTGYAAIVEIETTSALHLTLDRPLKTVKDRVNAWGGVVRVGWPRWLDRKEQTRRLVLGTQFKQHDVPAVFLDEHVTDALTTIELREAFPILTNTRSPSDAATWPKQVAAKGANMGVRRFQNETRWRINIDLRDDPEMHIPSALDLRLKLGKQLTDRWSVTVTLNGRLIHEDLLDQNTANYETYIPLPTKIITSSNVIEVTTTSTRTHEGTCARPIELVAEMLPETVLLAGDARFSDALSMLREHLSQLGGVSVGMASPLSAADADVASGLLAQVVPIDVLMKPVTDRPDIVVITPNDTNLKLPNVTPIWFVSQDVADNLVITRLEPQAELPHATFGLLIVSGGISLAEVSL
jgi:hypothetical protein